MNYIIQKQVKVRNGIFIIQMMNIVDFIGIKGSVEFLISLYINLFLQEV